MFSSSAPSRAFKVHEFVAHTTEVLCMAVSPKTGQVLATGETTVRSTFGMSSLLKTFDLLGVTRQQWRAFALILMILLL